MGAQDEVSSWLRVAIFYVLSPLLGAFIVIHETLLVTGGRLWLLALAMTLLGFPVADLADAWIKTRQKNGAEKG